MTEDRLQQRMSVYWAEQEEKRLANRQLIIPGLRASIDAAIAQARHDKKRTAYVPVERHCNEYMLELATEYSAANISIAYSRWNWLFPPEMSFGYILEYEWVISW